MSNLPDPAAGREAIRRDPLAERGRQILLAGQAPSGALVASPTFPVYRYAWLRDGSFCAQALELAGEPAAATAFHRWAARAIVAQRERAEKAIRSVRNRDVSPQYLPTRYTLDGELEPEIDDWPNFQLDGYGIWLQAVADHQGWTELPVEVEEAVRIISDYLSATWAVPCFDCWEEMGDGAHTSTLVAVSGGLRAAARLLHDDSLVATADLVSATVLLDHVHQGRLTKSRSKQQLDASLLWLGTTFELGDRVWDDISTATASAVEAELMVRGGGVRRYLGDSYYGGGEWLLLTSWLGWHAARTERPELSAACDAWVRGQATAEGQLAEQATAHPQVAGKVAEWTSRWGPVAQPLLWSHAMQIIHSAVMVEAGWRHDA